MSTAVRPLLILLRGLHKDRNTFTFSNVRYPSFRRPVYTIQLNNRPILLKLRISIMPFETTKDSSFLLTFPPQIITTWHAVTADVPSPSHPVMTMTTTEMGARFSAPVQTGPEAHPASCKMGTRSFQGVRCGRGVTLTPHPLLVPRSKIE